MPLRTFWQYWVFIGSRAQDGGALQSNKTLDLERQADKEGKKITFARKEDGAITTFGYKQITKDVALIRRILRPISEKRLYHYHQDQFGDSTSVKHL